MGVQTMALDEGVAARHFELATNTVMELINEYLQLGINQFGIGGDMAGNKPIISPASYKKYIAPELSKLSRYVHMHDGYTINASDGNLWPVIEDFLLTSEVDGYLEIDMRAGMDLSKLMQQFGHKITFYGNMDCGEILSFGTKNTIIELTEECLSVGLNHGKGGHIFCASNAISSSVPMDNYLAMVNTYKRFFDLPEIKV